MKPLTHMSHRRGFTLIEVLLAVAIFAIILAAINGVLISALRLRSHTTAATDELLPVDMAVGIIIGAAFGCR